MYDVGGGKILGTGISGMVRVVRHLQTGNTYAMKTLHLNRIKSKASLADLRNEVRSVDLPSCDGLLCLAWRACCPSCLLACARAFSLLAPSPY